MIKSNTVFVLGAGASRPFQFPTGQELRSQIVSDLFEPGTTLYQSLKYGGFDSPTINAFANTFRLSGLSSIDSLMALRQDISDIGRFAIAAALTPLQKEQRLYTALNDGGEAVDGYSNWYQFLYNLMREDVVVAGQLLENRVKFITFNYDLSLERFFYNAILHGFGAAAEDAFRLAQRICVHHVYGSLALQPEDVMTYPNTRTPEEFMAVAKGLQVMPHERPPEDERCVEILMGAKQIYFLGFGYDAMNCSRLGIRKITSGGPALGRPRIAGTAYGLTDAERGRAAGHLGIPSADRLADCSCLQLLRDNVDLLAPANG